MSEFLQKLGISCKELLNFAKSTGKTEKEEKNPEKPLQISGFLVIIRVEPIAMFYIGKKELQEQPSFFQQGRYCVSSALYCFCRFIFLRIASGYIAADRQNDRLLLLPTVKSG